jgi:lysophospholipase L1-like esterase
VKDDSNFVAILQMKFPAYKLINAASNAYGTGQSYLTLLRALQRHQDIRLVVYPFINHHLMRNYLRKDWIENLRKERQNVHFEIRNGQLTYIGLADRVRDVVSDTALLNRKEAEISYALVKAMSDTCQALNIPFLLTHLPDWQSGPMDTLIKLIVQTDHYIDLHKSIDLRAVTLPKDGHPNPEGHRRIAAQLLPFLQKSLVSQ